MYVKILSDGYQLSVQPHTQPRLAYFDRDRGRRGLVQVLPCVIKAQLDRNSSKVSYSYILTQYRPMIDDR
jgi:hypothetical protein